MAVSLARSGVAAVAMAGVLMGWQALLPHAGPLVVGGGGVLLGGGCYLAAAALAGAEELRTAARLVLRRGRR